MVEVDHTNMFEKIEGLPGEKVDGSGFMWRNVRVLEEENLEEVKKLIEEHGGRIGEVHNHENGGLVVEYWPEVEEVD